MAKVTLAPEFYSLQGKLCNKARTIIALNKKTGKMYRYDWHDREDPNSTSQQTVRTAFKSKAQAAATWYNSNKPSTTNTNGTADYIKVKKAYDAQSKYGNIYAFVRSLVNSTSPYSVQVPGGSSSSSSSSSSSDDDLSN